MGGPWEGSQVGSKGPKAQDARHVLIAGCRVCRWHTNRALLRGASYGLSAWVARVVKVYWERRLAWASEPE